jgi:hypothetical protein
VTRCEPRTSSSAQRGALLLSHREEQVLGRDVGVAQLGGVGVGPVEDALQLPAQRRLGRAAFLPGEAVELALDGLAQAGHVEAGLLEQRLHHALGLGQERGEQVSVVDDRVPPAPGEVAGIAEGFLGFDGQAVRSDHGRGSWVK